jgi:hypothetical protein
MRILAYCLHRWPNTKSCFVQRKRRSYRNPMKNSVWMPNEERRRSDGRDSRCEVDDGDEVLYPNVKEGFNQKKFDMDMKRIRTHMNAHFGNVVSTKECIVKTTKELLILCKRGTNHPTWNLPITNRSIMLYHRLTKMIRSQWVNHYYNGFCSVRDCWNFMING